MTGQEPEAVPFEELLAWYRRRLSEETEQRAMLEIVLERKNREILALKGGA